MDVAFRTGSFIHHLPESTAVLLADNLRAWPVEGDASRSVADKIERALVEESTEPIDLADLDERRAVRQVLDVIMAVPERLHDPMLREFFDSLGLEPRP